MHVLIVGGDPLYVRMIDFLLKDVGYQVTCAAEPAQAWRDLQRANIDLVLVDDEFSDGGGIDMCQRIRSQYHTPIIYTAEGSTVSERIRALKLGADDVLSRPYSPNELLARIEAVMRRYGDEFLRLHTAYEPISVGTLHLDPVQRRVVIEGEREENLTEREFQLLYYMAQNSRCVLSSRQILQQVWGMEDVESSNLVPVYIGRLRRKIERDPLHPSHIVRVRDMGYSFRP